MDLRLKFLSDDQLISLCRDLLAKGIYCDPRRIDRLYNLLDHERRVALKYIKRLTPRQTYLLDTLHDQFVECICEVFNLTNNHTKKSGRSDDMIVEDINAIASNDSIYQDILFINKWVINKAVDMFGDPEEQAKIAQELFEHGDVDMYKRLLSMNIQDRYDYLVDWSSTEIDIDTIADMIKPSREVYTRRLYNMYALNGLKPAKHDLTMKYIGKLVDKHYDRIEEVIRQVERKYKLTKLGVRWELLG